MSGSKPETVSSSSRLKKLVRPLVPRRVLQERQVIQNLGSPAAMHYLTLRAMDSVGVRGSNKRTVPAACRSIVFVCFGNIMRSPMAEMLLKRSLAECGIDGVNVSSFGIHASPGREAHPWAQTAARDFGISLAQHRSKLLTPETMAESDAIFAMDFQNKAELLAQYPECRQKIFLLSAYAEGVHRYREIKDPYHSDLEGTRRCYALLKTCTENLARSMTGSGKVRTLASC